MNHIAANLSCHFKIFADDLKIYMRVRHESDVHYLTDTDVCQSDITTLHSTASSWSLDLNQSKCAVLRFRRKSHVLNALPTPRYYIKGALIREVQSHPDLGLLVDCDLKFHLHVTSTVQKAAGLAQNLIKSTVCRKPEFMMSLFRSHIRPILEYCSCVWNTGYVGDLRLLESVQRRWTKRVEHMENLDYRSRLESLRQFSVTGRLRRSEMIQCWKIFHEKSPIKPHDLFTLAPQAGTRGHSFKIGHTRTQTDVRRRMFAIRCVDSWNSLPDHVVTETNLKAFKSALADALGAALYDYPD